MNDFIIMRKYADRKLRDARYVSPIQVSRHSHEDR